MRALFLENKHSNNSLNFIHSFPATLAQGNRVIVKWPSFLHISNYFFNAHHHRIAAQLPPSPTCYSSPLVTPPAPLPFSTQPLQQLYTYFRLPTASQFSSIQVFCNLTSFKQIYSPPPGLYSAPPRPTCSSPLLP